MVKPNNYWYYEVSKCAPYGCFEVFIFTLGNVASRLVSSQPKFKKKGRDDSFTLDGSISVGFNRIKLPRIGWIKT